jgi:hypothetical protein
MDGTAYGQQAAGALQRFAPGGRKPDECGINGAKRHVPMTLI